MVDCARDSAAIAVRDYVHSGSRGVFGRMKRGVSYSRGLGSAVANMQGRQPEPVPTSSRPELPVSGRGAGGGDGSAVSQSVPGLGSSSASQPPGTFVSDADKRTVLDFLEKDDDEAIEMPQFDPAAADKEGVPLTRLSIKGRGLWGLAAPVAEAPMPLIPQVSACVQAAVLPPASSPPSEMAAGQSQQASMYKHLATFAAVDREIHPSVADARVWEREQAAALRSEIAVDVTLLICQLARDEESRASLVVAGAAGALLSLIERRGFPAGVSQSALRALCMLAIDRDSTIETASGRQVTAAALAASAAQDEEVRQQVRALVRKRLRALLRLGDSSGAAVAAGSAGDADDESDRGASPRPGDGPDSFSATRLPERSPSDLAVVF